MSCSEQPRLEASAQARVTALLDEAAWLQYYIARAEQQAQSEQADAATMQTLVDRMDIVAYEIETLMRADSLHEYQASLDHERARVLSMVKSWARIQVAVLLDEVNDAMEDLQATASVEITSLQVLSFSPKQVTAYSADRDGAQRFNGSRQEAHQWLSTLVTRAQRVPEHLLGEKVHAALQAAAALSPASSGEEIQSCARAVKTAIRERSVLYQAGLGAAA